MTQKDYIRIARALSNLFPPAEPGYTAVAERRRWIFAAACAVADELARGDPNFDREHFLAVVRGEK